MGQYDTSLESQMGINQAGSQCRQSVYACTSLDLEGNPANRRVLESNSCFWGRKVYSWFQFSKRKMPNFMAAGLPFKLTSVALIAIRLQTGTAREQRNVEVIEKLQQSSASSFANMQSTFSGAMDSAQNLVQQSSRQLNDLIQQRDQEYTRLQAGFSVLWVDCAILFMIVLL